MEVHQMLVSMCYGDAITDYSLEIQKILRRQGYHSEIFVEMCDSRMWKHIRRFEEYPKISSPSNILILHFSILSQVSKLAYHLPDKKILIYHNITPSIFFADFHPHLAGECYHGRRELKAFKDKCDLALGDSEFNRQELENLGFPQTGVLPIILNFRKFEPAPDPLVPHLYPKGRTTFLFVGRMVPNKRVEDIIKLFYCYHKYINPKSQLILVGEYRGFERYYDSLRNLSAELSLEDVHFTGHVELEELIAYYKMADVYISMSEHEGFCVPILEAFYFQTPVVAYNSAAVPYTMRGAGVMVNHKDHPLIAELIHHILSHPSLKEEIIASQNRILANLKQAKSDRLLLKYVEMVAGR
ncbi:hypothetical protein CEE39_00330 [bacterium (candidate division B38) B3_B38]|nr:MAG: hypothetical protein CEE39_00330 [bacterium (candidate division B38) B3_B38]